MLHLDLKYGRSSIPVAFADRQFEVLSDPAVQTPLTDAEIGKRLDSPIGTPPLDEIISPGQTVLIVVPDATRQAAAGQIVNLLVRRLIANGTAPHEISTIFATGIHRQVTPEEKAAILTPFVYQRIKTLDHDPRDLARLVRFGETTSGIAVELDRALTEHDHVVLVGGVAFHYFAGFTGGRKLICPGLASSRTIADTHRLAFDCETKSRRAGVGPGLLDNNAVHEAFVEAVQRIDPSFSVNSIVNDAGEAVDVYCGHWVDSHIAACNVFARDHTVVVIEKRDVVIASCGGWPYDINLVQAHKALEVASYACNEGGTIILLAECADGLGRHDFLDWFEERDSDGLAAELCKKYQVNGQTAWSLLRKAERFDVRIVTELDEALCAKMRIRKISINDIERLLADGERGYVLTNGAKVLVKVSQ